MLDLVRCPLVLVVFPSLQVATLDVFLVETVTVEGKEKRTFLSENHNKMQGSVSWQQ